MQTNAVTNMSNGAAAAFGNSLNVQNMGKAEFLNLLVAQLQNQDPFQPMEGNDFAAQLAQFSSLEELTSINASLKDGTNMDLMLTQAVNNTLAANFIGKEVTSLGDTISLVSGDHPSMNFLLNDFADKVTVKIYDEAGNVVRTIEASGLAAGKQSLEWDGLGNDGQELPGGNYRFSVEAENVKGEQVQAQTLTKGIVSSVRYVDGRAVLIVNGKEINLSDVLEIG